MDSSEIDTVEELHGICAGAAAPTADKRADAVFAKNTKEEFQT